MSNLKKLSRLMKMSWEIQKRRRTTRSRALVAAWSILNNEDVTVFYLVQRYNLHKPLKQNIGQMGLFTRN